MKRWIMPIGILLCVYFDSIFFAKLNIAGIRPDVMLAFVVSFSILEGPLMGAVLGGAGGLLMDILFGRALGVYAALYLIAAVAAGVFYGKFYADNVVIPAVTAVIAGIAKDLVLALIVLAMGTKFQFAMLLVQYILPCALSTGVMCLLIHLLLKPMVARQVARRRAERLAR
ncbi:MAG: rod shape-determining protein MreD [Eubacteriales bacterium]|nr:rod shape-determining protein MreD [Eubacteriales bacterium]